MEDFSDVGQHGIAYMEYNRDGNSVVPLKRNATIMWKYKMEYDCKICTQRTVNELAAVYLDNRYRILLE